MMRMHLEFWPFGLRGTPEYVASLDVLDEGGGYYRYSMKDGKGGVLSSREYKCPVSLTRNPWHHMAAIMEAAAPDLKNRRDYTTTSLDEVSPRSSDAFCVEHQCWKAFCTEKHKVSEAA